MILQEFIFFLGLFLGVLSVVNKVLFLLRRPSGWVTGIFIGLVSAAYFWWIGLAILALAEIGFAIVMVHGFILNHRRIESRNTQTYDRHARALLAILLIAISANLFRGNITVLELVSSNSFLWGGYAFASAQRLFGWLLWVFAHAATALASAMVGEPFFAFLQLCSGTVCLFAFIGIMCREKRMSGSDHPGS